MSSRGLVIFDAFNTLVTARHDSRATFLDGLASVGLTASAAMLAELQAASEGIDHSAWSGSRETYVAWAAWTLTEIVQAGGVEGSDLAPFVVPALEQMYQAPMVALPGAAACLAALKTAGFRIAVCSNWGWDLREDLEGTGLTTHIDYLVTSAQAGFRKPHSRIYQSTLDLTGFTAANAVFVGDSLRTDVLGPQRVGARSVLLARAPPGGFRGEQARSLAAVARLLIDRQILNALASGGAGSRRRTERTVDRKCHADYPPKPIPSGCLRSRRPRDVGG
jgi:putative hydrolase of the HAD superfamily